MGFFGQGQLVGAAHELLLVVLIAPSTLLLQKHLWQRGLRTSETTLVRVDQSLLLRVNLDNLHVSRLKHEEVVPVRRRTASTTGTVWRDSHRGAGD